MKASISLQSIPSQNWQSIKATLEAYDAISNVLIIEKKKIITFTCKSHNVLEGVKRLLVEEFKDSTEIQPS